jgi:hypothetical protein
VLGIKIAITFAIFDGFHAFNLCVDVDCFGGFGGIDGLDVVNGFDDSFVAVNSSNTIAGIIAISGVVFLAVVLAVAFLGVGVGFGGGFLACC